MRTLLRLIAWTTLGLAAGIGAAVAGPLALGWHPLAVLSGSMAPTLNTGDEVVVRPIRPSTLNIGDIVTFNDPSRGQRLVTHRVRSVRVSDGTVHVTTRGDANDTSERWSVATGGHVGRVMYRLPKLGYLTVTAGKPLGRVLLVVIPAIALGLSEIWHIWRRPSRSVFRGRSPQIVK